jgi:hypothetical protein
MSFSPIDGMTCNWPLSANFYSTPDDRLVTPKIPPWFSRRCVVGLGAILKLLVARRLIKSPSHLLLFLRLWFLHNDGLAVTWGVAERCNCLHQIYACPAWTICVCPRVLFHSLYLNRMTFRFEWFISLDFEWDFITGTKKFRWPMVSSFRLSICTVHATLVISSDILFCWPLSHALHHDRSVSRAPAAVPQMLIPLQCNHTRCNKVRHG